MDYSKIAAGLDRYKNICNMGFIYDTKNLLELKQSPFDRGKDIFKQLYKEVFWLWNTYKRQQKNRYHLLNKNKWIILSNGKIY